ncbi:MAG: dihydropteroate synthase [Dehalococcoidia bacterium]|nr:dihydropteroate synthase [Dehalococcoidia bacterium]RLC61171.1 MAG: pterin-binding protein [Chloroflexota bacterium]
MKTRLSSATKEVIIGDELPTVIIGERINPTGKKKMTAALEAGDFDIVRKEALAQIEAGADVLDVNAATANTDEVTLLPKVVQVVMDTVDVPLCLDSSRPEALEAALKLYKGKPLINSVTGQEDSLREILPLVKEYKAAVIGMTVDDEGIPDEVERRVAIAHKIVERAEKSGIAREDIIIDCVTMTLGADPKSALVTIESLRRIKEELGVNMTLGASNVSFGLPNRDLINSAFLAVAMAAGLNCPVINAAKMRPTVLAVDLILGHDNNAMRYIKAQRQSSQGA